jgi:hypothetical protein
VTWFAWLSRTNIEDTLIRIEQKLDQLMAQVSVEQDTLNTIGTELGNIADAVQVLVDDSSNPLQAADLTSITDPLARIQDILPHVEPQ